MNGEESGCVSSVINRLKMELKRASPNADAKLLNYAKVFNGGARPVRKKLGADKGKPTYTELLVDDSTLKCACSSAKMNVSKRFNPNDKT